MTDLTPADWELPAEEDPQIAKLRAAIQNPILKDAYESRLKALRAEVAEVEAKLKALPREVEEKVFEPDPAEEEKTTRAVPAAKKPPARKHDPDPPAETDKK